jgi:hypothetical protein
MNIDEIIQWSYESPIGIDFSSKNKETLVASNSIIKNKRKKLCW